MQQSNTAVWPKVSISTNAETGLPQLAWEAIAGAERYEIWCATSKDGNYRHIWTVTNNHYTNTSAVAGNTYYYKVQPVGVDVPCSEVAYITCDCAAPQLSIKTEPSTGLPVLTWDPVRGAAQYEVYRATSSKGTYTKMWTVNSPSYRNTTAQAGNTYYYKVKALCTRSRYGDGALSKPAYITCDCAAPVVSVCVEDGEYSLIWDAVAGAGKYEIYRAASADGTFMRIATVETDSYTIPRVADGTTWYKVKALCAKTAYGDSDLSQPVSVCAE